MGHLPLVFPNASELHKITEYIFGSHNNMCSKSNYFEISETGLVYVGADENQTILNHAVINREKLLLFRYQTLEMKPYRFHIDAKEFKTQVKNSSRNKPLYLLNKHKEKNIVLSSSCNQPSGVTSIEQTSSNSKHIFSIPELDYVEGRPNAVIPVSELKELCSTITSQVQVRILVSENYVNINKYSDKILRGAHQFTSNRISGAENLAEDTIICGLVPGALIKNLGKLGNVAPCGVVQLYAQAGKPIMLKLPLRYMGTLTVYISLRLEI